MHNRKANIFFCKDRVFNFYLSFILGMYVVKKGIFNFIYTQHNQQQLCRAPHPKFKSFNAVTPANSFFLQLCNNIAYLSWVLA